MRHRRNRRLLRKSFKIVGADKIIFTYFVYFTIIAIILRFVEPEIGSFFDSYWYCFAVATSVGFGDVVAVTLIGRILTMILSVYSIAIVAIFTAVVTHFFVEIARINAEENLKALIEEMEHLPELSQEELEALSERIKKFSREKLFFE